MAFLFLSFLCTATDQKYDLNVKVEYLYLFIFHFSELILSRKKQKECLFLDMAAYWKCMYMQLAQSLYCILP